MSHHRRQKLLHVCEMCRSYYEECVQCLTFVVCNSCAWCRCMCNVVLIWVQCCQACCGSLECSTYMCGICVIYGYASCLLYIYIYIYIYMLSCKICFASCFLLMRIRVSSLMLHHASCFICMYNVYVIKHYSWCITRSMHVYTCILLSMLYHASRVPASGSHDAKPKDSQYNNLLMPSCACGTHTLHALLTQVGPSSPCMLVHSHDSSKHLSKW